jgi:hypothetical protein
MKEHSKKEMITLSVSSALVDSIRKKQDERSEEREEDEPCVGSGCYNRCVVCVIEMCVGCGAMNCLTLYESIIIKHKLCMLWMNECSYVNE